MGLICPTNFGKMYGPVHWTLAGRDIWTSPVHCSIWHWLRKRWGVHTRWYPHTPTLGCPCSQLGRCMSSCHWCWCTPHSAHMAKTHTRQRLIKIRLPKPQLLFSHHIKHSVIFTNFSQVSLVVIITQGTFHFQST